MLLRDFYQVIATEESTCSFLRKNGLLEQSNAVINCHRCGTQMRPARKRNRAGEFRPIFRCPKKGCQTSHSIRAGNKFFTYTNLNGKLHCNLKLGEILELVYMFVIEIPLSKASVLTGKSKATVNDWFRMCREVCGSIISVTRRGQMTGTRKNAIQIHGIRFTGKQKYNRGQILDDDQRPNSIDSVVKIENNQNCGAQVDVPWFFCLKKGLDIRYFCVQKLNRATLFPIILQHCTPGSHIHSDERPFYSSLSTFGFVHTTVNHQQHYMDPVTGVHTQSVERLCLDARIKIKKKVRSTKSNMLQSHLDEYCWRFENKNVPDLFIKFLNEIGTVYR